MTTTDALFDGIGSGTPTAGHPRRVVGDSAPVDGFRPNQDDVEASWSPLAGYARKEPQDALRVTTHSMWLLCTVGCALRFF